MNLIFTRGEKPIQAVKMLNGRKNKSKIICTFASNCNTFCCGGCNYNLNIKQ